ncbi:biotin--[acetyl-CoA-carboxylase] ligase [uncultured Helicobacter sp.]|uniref:biotin--[acetyl-CoA-carboxylase] ligase n=1 Tax=uncultured Helicobacter sp. TaxID=175537 RepID=UPI002609B5DF|nr:biotin--[acetyl-CoA-carboxylase] ligase [uncultured Helicobacter sp.]
MLDEIKQKPCFDETFITTLKTNIYHFDILPSTQTYAIEALKTHSLTAPFCIHATHQSDGIGSRGNQWESMSNALLFSFALPLKNLPQDLRIESSSIFFGVIMREFLASLGSQVWLKYPNDLYIGQHKIGGILTQKVNDCLVCGIGINIYPTLESPQSPHQHNYATLEEPISQNIQPVRFLERFFESFKKFILWKQIFSIYKLEFHKNNSFFFHLDEKKICLKDTILNEDGSLSINGHKIYSLR